MRNGIRFYLLLAPALAALGACSIEGTPGGITKDPYVPPAGPTPYTPPATTPQDRKVVILHTNDEHSHLLGFAPVSDYPFLPEADGSVDPAKVAARIGKDTKTVGGAVRRQHEINRIRAQSADPVLLLSAGDATMGTLFHAAGASAAPDFVVMAALGYDFMTLGNHEFDWGPDTLSAEIRTAQRTLFGGAVPILASNLSFDDVAKDASGKLTGPGADLAALVGPGNSGAPIMPWATKTLANGLKVGLFGLMGYEAQLVAAGKGPIAFSVPLAGATCTKATVKTDCAAGESCTRGRCVNPLDDVGHVTAIAADAQAVVDQLRKVEKVDLVIALTHLGQAEDLALAQLTTGIDVIVGGHSHDVVTPTVVPSATAGKTIVVQAGSYGTRLGQLTVSVSPQAEVALLDTGSLQHELDGELDTEIYEGTDLTVSPPVVSPALEAGLGLTGGLIGPVLAGLNEALGPMLEGILDPTGQTPGTPAVLDPIATSTYDVVGEVAFKDTNLSHLVTDASLSVLMQGACLNPATERVVAVQANGVIRDSLRFGAGGTTTFFDIFGVLPLGASPWADASVAAPGFPVTMYRLTAVQLFAGADVGVTKGLESDSFFLSYAGMRVTFDRALPPFDLAKLKAGQDPGGRITKIELDLNPLPTGETWKAIYRHDAAKPFPARWTDVDETTPINPMTYPITVISNLYLTGFLDAFGLKPLAADGGTACTTGADCESGVCTAASVCQPELVLPQTVMCVTVDAIMGTFDCAQGRPAMARCVDLPGSTLAPTPRWSFPEVKEWIALTQYLASFPGATLPPLMYAGDVPASPRVIEVTP